MDNSKTQKLILAGLLILAIISIGAWLFPQPPRAIPISGNGTGSMNAEDYNPYIMYNGGYYSAKPIETTSTLTVAGLSALTTAKIGSSGSTVSGELFGTCTAASAVTSYTATSTYAWACPVTGVVSGDKVIAQAVTPGFLVSGIGSFAVQAANATSSNYLELRVMNITGAATSSVSNAYMQINYWILR